MSDVILNDFDDEEQKEIEKNLKKHSSNKLKIILPLSIIIIIGIIVAIIIIVLKNKSDKEDNKQSGIDFDISTVNFNPEILYQGSHYNYDGDLVIIYKKTEQGNYCLAISDDNGTIINKLYEFQKNEVDETYIHRASSFSDGKRILIGGKILECVDNKKKLKDCEKTILIDVEFPKELNKLPNLWFLFTEPIVNYGGKYIFWSTFDKALNIINFVGELNFKNGKYIIENTKGLSNYFYDLYNKENGTYSLPKILRFGPIKQVIDGGKALSIGGFLNYGLRKGIYQSLSKDELTQLTFFEGYDETTAISPDSKLACVMTTRFSEKTSFEIVGLIPTPYSILASYLVSIDILNYSIFNLRSNPKIKGNIGPALVELDKVKNDKNYKGKNLCTNDSWNFNGFISWSPDGKKIMFDEVDKNSKKRRCQIVKLKNYKPGNIKFEDNFNINVPYARTINETMNLHLDYPINIKVDGKSGYLEIHHDENICEINYYNYTEDNEVFYTGKYSYEKFNDKKYAIFKENIKSEGKKKGNCDFRLWFDTSTNMFLFDEHTDGNKKSYGSCNYEGKTINVNIYKQE